MAAPETLDIRLQIPDEVTDLNVQRIGYDLERLNGDIALAAFDLTDVRPIQAREISKDILRPLALHS